MERTYLSKLIHVSKRNIALRAQTISPCANLQGSIVVLTKLHGLRLKKNVVFPISSNTKCSTKGVVLQFLPRNMYYLVIRPVCVRIICFCR